MYKIENTELAFYTRDEARENLMQIQASGQTKLLNVLRDHIRWIPDEDTFVKLNLAYQSIVDALDYVDAGRETGDAFLDKKLDSYIEEE